MIDMTPSYYVVESKTLAAADHHHLAQWVIINLGLDVVLAVLAVVCLESGWIILSILAFIGSFIAHSIAFIIIQKRNRG